MASGLLQRRSPDDVVLSSERTVAAAPELVFAVVTDFELFVRLEEGVSRVTIISDHAEGVGVRSRWELVDQSTGEQWTLDEEVVSWDPPFRYAYTGNGGGKDYSGVHTLTRNPDGTTHHRFDEAFHFAVDRGVYQEVIEGLMSHVKREAERRAAAARL